MPGTAVDQVQIEMFQQQWRRTTLLVDPRDHGIMDPDEVLIQYPVGESAATR